ncbi:hypothetical protein RIF29_27693 [Crotalaria pallida]|uniref:Uncharacterized protein n=1 Tax=Crotalaria pallida TaxID=3830 RepID=A0AAN9I195_CROPI
MKPCSLFGFVGGGPHQQEVVMPLLSHWLFSLLPFVSVLPMQLSMSPTASAPCSQYLQMKEESYFEFLVII